MGENTGAQNKMGGKMDQRSAEQNKTGGKMEQNAGAQNENGGKMQRNAAEQSHGQNRGKMGQSASRQNEGQNAQRSAQNSRHERSMGREGMNQQRTAQEHQRSGNHAQRNERNGQTAQGNERNERAGQTAQRNQRNGQATAQREHGLTGLQGNARANVQLNDQQRTRIRDTVISARGAPRIGHVNFNVAVGTVVPRTGVHIVPVPSSLVAIEPSWRGLRYFVYEDEIVLVDPATMTIVAVVNV